MIPDWIWMYVGIFSTVLAAVLLVALVWRRGEQRRASAAKLMRDHPELAMLPHTWAILSAYATLNWFGANSVTREIHNLIDDVRSAGIVPTYVKIGWWAVTEVFVKSPDALARLKAIVAAAEKVETPITPPAPPAA